MERLYFIDALRAWAILMMLQGHFVSALLAESYRDGGNWIYLVWAYLRGLTAPVFFFVSGFIFMYLLFRNYRMGLSNPRVKKGAKRGAMLIFLGYILQIRFGLLFQGKINESYDIVHVLQCLGLSLLLIILLYIIMYRFKPYILTFVLASITVVLFMSNASFELLDYKFLPEWMANYLTRQNGSVFTIVPWFGFATAGAFLSYFFRHCITKERFYRNILLIMFVIALLLIFQSYEFLRDLQNLTDMPFFQNALRESYLFSRLGMILLVFVLFILLRNYFNHKLVLDIGQNTLGIYLLHSIVLYGSITGYGLSRFHYHSLSLFQALSGAVCFVALISLSALTINIKVKQLIK